MSKKQPKYPTYTALAEAFKAGKLDDYILVLDNDSCRLAFRGERPDGLSDDAWEIFEERRYDECHEWFEGEGYSDIEPLCAAAGIPAEWC